MQSVSSSLRIKVALGNDMRIFRHSGLIDVYASFLEFISSSFSLHEFYVQFQDNEGDKITVFDSNDFQYALDAAKQENRRSLKFFVVPGNIKKSHGLNDDNQNEAKDESSTLIGDLLGKFGAQLNDVSNHSGRELEDLMNKVLSGKCAVQESPFITNLVSMLSNGDQCKGAGCGALNQIKAEFVKNVTLPDRSYYPVDTILTKTWRVRNNGKNAWGNRVFLTFLKGNKCLTLDEKYPIQDDVKPGQFVDVSAMIQTPKKAGRYVCYYRLKKNGKFFGPKLWCDIYVIQEKDDFECGQSKKIKRELNKKLDENIDVKQLKFEKRNEKLDRKLNKLENKSNELKEQLLEMQNDDDDNNNNPKFVKKQNKIKQKLDKNEIKLKKIGMKQKNLVQKQQQFNDVDMDLESASNSKSESMILVNMNDTDEEEVESNKNDDFIYVEQFEAIKKMGFQNDDQQIRQLLLDNNGNIQIVIQTLITIQQ